MKFADNITAFLISVLGHRAAIDDTYISLLGRCHTDKSALLKLAGESGTLGEVEFAT